MCPDRSSYMQSIPTMGWTHADTSLTLDRETNVPDFSFETSWTKLDTAYKIQKALKKGAGLADIAVFLRLTALYWHSDFPPHSAKIKNYLKGYLPTMTCLETAIIKKEIWAYKPWHTVKLCHSMNMTNASVYMRRCQERLNIPTSIDLHSSVIKKISKQPQPVTLCTVELTVRTSWQKYNDNKKYCHCLTVLLQRDPTRLHLLCIELFWRALSLTESGNTKHKKRCFYHSIFKGSDE